MNELAKQMSLHEKNDERRFGEIGASLTVIREKHLVHLQDSYDSLDKNMALVRNDLKWQGKIGYGILFLVLTLAAAVISSGNLHF